MIDPKRQEIFSLLWPEGTGKAVNHWRGAQCEPFVEDLNLAELALAISYDQFHPVTVDKLITYITDNVSIIEYRLDILEDLLANPDLRAAMESALPLIDELEETNMTDARGSNNDPPFIQTVRRLGELEVYVDCIHKLQLGFVGCDVKSAGLSRLKAIIGEVYEDPDFKALMTELPKLRAGFSSLASVTLGINLDSQLRPCEATLLSINDQRFQGGSLLNRFTNKRKNESAYQGISPLLKIERIYNFEDNQWVTQGNPFHTAIFTELNHIVGSIAKPIAAEIKQYTKFNSRLFVSLRADLVFLLGVAKFIQRIQAAELPLCRPIVLKKEERIFKVREIYNINLACQYALSSNKPHAKMVLNQVDFDDRGRIFILTGPNRGGKTTYTQAVGLAQVLCQLGIFVPGREAAISPVDAIYTHYPVLERPDSNLGRLGEESKRLGEIFENATRYSLILLNESLSSTSPGEGLYLSREIVAGLKLLGARVIFATHFHDLAANLEEFNEQNPGDSCVISMVSGIDSSAEDSDEAARRTFKILPGPPQGMSYAKDIACRYGISYEQLVQTMSGR